MKGQDHILVYVSVFTFLFPWHQEDENIPEEKEELPNDLPHSTIFVVGSCMNIGEHWNTFFACGKQHAWTFAHHWLLHVPRGSDTCAAWAMAVGTLLPQNQRWLQGKQDPGQINSELKNEIEGKQAWSQNSEKLHI